MTNFEFFKDKCQNTEVFAYHIYYKDGRFESKRNEQLNNISEEDILYFEGFYEVNGYLQSVNTCSRIRGYGVAARELDSNFRMFGVNMLFYLNKLGVGDEEIDSITSILYREYSEEEASLGKTAYEEFLNIWNNEYMKEE